MGRCVDDQGAVRRGGKQGGAGGCGVVVAPLLGYDAQATAQVVACGGRLCELQQRGFLCRGEQPDCLRHAQSGEALRSVARRRCGCRQLVEGVVAAHQPRHAHHVRRVQHDKAGQGQRLRGEANFVLPAQAVEEQQVLPLVAGP